jgi:23S rRNA pseudouridine1911/1915/1917 synthase
MLNGLLADPQPTSHTLVRVLYEDAALLAVDKPAGMVTHPAYKHPDGTLADAVFARQATRGEARPWLLHRLDRETSGVVLFAKTEAARRALVRQFERHSMCKVYLALTLGVPAPLEGTVDAPLRRDPADRRRMIVDAEGQPARTRYWTLNAKAQYALVLAQPLSGRTHQIRIHLAARSAPLLGDATYQSPDAPFDVTAPRTCLHAWRLVFSYPGSGVPFSIEAPVPADFTDALLRVGLADGLARAEEIAAHLDARLSRASPPEACL